MKLFVVACLKESQDDITKIFTQANIHVFSVTDVIGFKDNQPTHLPDDWFARGDERFDSLLIFSFTTSENAEKGLEMIKKYNEISGTDFPARAFIVPVEKASY